MSNIKLFESRQIRTAWNEAEQKWYFSVQDVVEILTESSDVKQYIKKMLSRDEQLKNNWGTICTLVEMEAADGKRRKVQAADTKGLLRIIQSIPSPKAEPFKLWLAQVGSDRLTPTSLRLPSDPQADFSGNCKIRFEERDEGQTYNRVSRGEFPTPKKNKQRLIAAAC